MAKSPIAGLFIAALSLAACKERVGGDCVAPEQAVCGDNQSALVCLDGKFASMPCRGPKGCATNGSTLTCDNSIAQEKDGCDEENDVACSVDKKAALECHNRTFSLGETCKGTRGCEAKDDKVTCDNDTSDVGDPCVFDGDYACTSDKTFVLKCVGHQMKKFNSCRGAKSCRVFELPEEKKAEFVCDDAIAQLNDPCDEEGEVACSMDRKAMYHCKSAAFVAMKDCTGPKGCTFDDKGEKFECDQTSGTGKPVDVKQPVPPGVPQKGGKKT